MSSILSFLATIFGTISHIMATIEVMVVDGLIIGIPYTTEGNFCRVLLPAIRYHQSVSFSRCTSADPNRATMADVQDNFALAQTFVDAEFGVWAIVQLKYGNAFRGSGYGLGFHDALHLISYLLH